MNSPRRPIGGGAQTQFHQSVHDQVFNGSKLVDSPSIKWSKTSRGISGKVRLPGGNVGSGGTPRLRGAWARDTVYSQFDVVHVMERLGYALDAAGNIEPRFYSTWWWPHVNDSATEPNANPNCPTIIAPFMDADQANWPYVYNEFSPGAAVYSEGDARDTPFNTPIVPPDPERSWTLMSAIMLPLNFGSGLVVDVGGHHLRFCNGILVGDST